jgi:hypothetical protein
MRRRWQFLGPALLLFTSLCGVVVFLEVDAGERFDHSTIRFERALELLRTCRDHELRLGALGQLHDEVGAAIRLVLAAAAAGDEDAAATLAHWRALLDH